MATEANKAKFRAALEGAVDKYVKQQGRNTTALNAERDSACAGYARIPGPDACDFCVTMGAGNDFYHTEESAGGGAGHGSADDAYHAHCNCQICMVFKKGNRYVARDPETGEAVPYDGAEMVRRYNEAGRPTFAHNRPRENENRRIRRHGGEPTDSRSTGSGARTIERPLDYIRSAQTAEEVEARFAEVYSQYKRMYGEEGLRKRISSARSVGKERIAELKDTAGRSASKGDFEGSFGKLTAESRAAYMEADDMASLFNKRNGAMIEMEGDFEAIGKEKTAAIFSGFERSCMFIDEEPARIKFISVGKLEKGDIARIERMDNSDVVVRFSRSQAVKRSADEMEQVAFHEIAHLAEDRFTSKKMLAKERDGLIKFRNGTIEKLEQSEASKLLEDALRNAGFDVRYDKLSGKIKIAGEGQRTLLELPKNAWYGADLGGQDSELIAESIRFVALHGFGVNKIADVVVRLFLL